VKVGRHRAKNGAFKPIPRHNWWNPTRLQATSIRTFLAILGELIDTIFTTRYTPMKHSETMRRTFWIYVAIAILAMLARGGGASAAEPAGSLAELESVLPSASLDFTAETTARVLSLVDRLEEAEYQKSLYSRDADSATILKMVEDLVITKARVDELLQETLAKRTQFLASEAGEPRRKAIRQFLLTTSALTDLSGRLRYLSYDALHEAAYDLRNNEAGRKRLLEILTEHKSTIGAAVMAQVILLPPRSPENDTPAATSLEQSQVLKLIRETRQHDLVGLLARYIRSAPDPRLQISAAATIRRVGMPQKPRPEADPTLPKPAIEADELHTILSRIDGSQLPADWNARREELIGWLDIRRREGEPDETYRLGQLDLQAGDWFLMRNASPYNLFTDLSPGLFTHVGVVTVERGSDGIRRFVVIDLPERGNYMPAVTVDTFVKRTLDYAFLRHADDAVREEMGDVARTIIGNESHFDLGFRTDGIKKLKGQDLQGKKIHGYCAGLLLLCAQATEAPHQDFFPIPEHPAGGNTQDNLSKLEISMGHDFLSPTGPLFSERMLLVGRREPMYNAKRQIDQAVYDHFADNLKNKVLVPSPDWFQSMRQSMAEASKGNPLLAKALARTAGVNENMDLVAAAKLGAVVETLDEIAYGASGEYLQARAAMREPMVRSLRRRQADERVRQTRLYQQRHAELYRSFSAGNLSPRQLRVELVRYYINKGNRQLDERFFGSDTSE